MMTFSKFFFYYIVKFKWICWLLTKENEKLILFRGDDDDDGVNDLYSFLFVLKKLMFKIILNVI